LISDPTWESLKKVVHGIVTTIQDSDKDEMPLKKMIKDNPELAEELEKLIFQALKTKK